MARKGKSTEEIIGFLREAESAARASGDGGQDLLRCENLQADILRESTAA
jgi:hypothetical protein